MVFFLIIFCHDSELNKCILKLFPCTGGQYLSYEWCWSTVHSEGASEQNMSTVAVIDGGIVGNTVIAF